MIDRGKVIKGLECLISNEVPCEGCPYYGSGYCLRNIAKDAMDLLKEQEAKFVQNIGQQLSCKSGTCPNCGKMLNTICNRHFCGKCGQAVKWDA